MFDADTSFPANRDVPRNDALLLDHRAFFTQLEGAARHAPDV
ncbi:hypothetical protein [Deinococcus sp. PEB2-63]